MIHHLVGPCRGTKFDSVDVNPQKGQSFEIEKQEPDTYRHALHQRFQSTTYMAKCSLKTSNCEHFWRNLEFGRKWQVSDVFKLVRRNLPARKSPTATAGVPILRHCYQPLYVSKKDFVIIMGEIHAKKIVVKWTTTSPIRKLRLWIA